MNLDPSPLDVQADMLPQTLRSGPTGQHFMRGDGIVVQLVQAKRQELAHARKNIETFNQLAAGKKTLLLVDMRSPFSTGPGVRQFYASPEANEFVKAMALLIASDTGRIIGNFFMTLNSPPSPCRMFTNVNAAVKWLKSF